MKIEELSDEFADTVKVSDAQQNASQPPPPQADLLTQAMNAFASSSTQTTNEDGSTGPALPPAMAALRNKSGEEILAELNKTPLFMTSLEENDDLEALKALAYEGTPFEVAAGFKERGNESFKEKGWKDAKEFYGKGIQVLLLEVRKRQKGEGEANDQEEIKKEVGILEQCLVNRAACHLRLKNYRSCVQDCGSALRINSKNVKAFYRSSKALLQLDKIAEADDACARGLAVDPGNRDLLEVANEIIKRNEEVEKRRKRELERENRRRLEGVTLTAALKARGIKTRKTSQPPEMEDARIELVPNPIDPQSSVSFPTVLLYPLHLESDFVKAFNEMESVGDHLSYILPLPWDKQGVYTTSGVDCYMETVTGGLIKVGRKVSLLKVLTSGNVEVVDEVVKIFVLPKANSDAWVQEFKSKKLVEKTTG
ncbi:TPR-like protein [Mollisia scopiformis]|uniref:TPR-like protein n=1 Tax=Mollisia scopiformis TaxID=149040 RepID=A0A194XB72_MOLSC|nr:TPR-like protein [Mollisia scopiformis]KUJ17007.1 TPR-like protein [Mollisia scopiformis]